MGFVWLGVVLVDVILGVFKLVFRIMLSDDFLFGLLLKDFVIDIYWLLLFEVVFNFLWMVFGIGGDVL